MTRATYGSSGQSKNRSDFIEVAIVAGVAARSDEMVYALVAGRRKSTIEFERALLELYKNVLSSRDKTIIGSAVI